MTKPNAVDILGVSIDAITIEESHQLVGTWIKDAGSAQTETKYMVKPYVQLLARAQRDRHIKSILNEANACVADGVSLQWAASYLYGKPHSKPTYGVLLRSLIVWLQRPTWRNQILPEKFAGIDHTRSLLDEASKQGWRVGVLGGSAKPNQTKQELSRRWPQLNLIDVWSGFTHTTRQSDFDSWEKDGDFVRIHEAMQAARLDLLLVGMGFPRQELFMHFFRKHKLTKVMVGEGGSFDYAELGGTQKRAPKVLRKLGLEWLWRLLQQPSRIRRQLVIPRYILAVHTQAKKNWKNHSPKQ